jgi:hypothetical protein
VKKHVTVKDIERQLVQEQGVVWVYTAPWISMVILALLFAHPWLRPMALSLMSMAIFLILIPAAAITIAVWLYRMVKRGSTSMAAAANTRRK